MVECAAVVVKNMFKSYSAKNVFYDLNVEFEKHKITMVLGPSGCGKTTLLNIIAGIDSDYSGEVLADRERLAYVFQEDRLLPNLTALENIMFVLNSSMKRKDACMAANKYLDMVQLQDCKDRPPMELSGGMKRRVALARAVAYNARLVLMDEPFKGLDNELKNKIMGELLEIHMQRNDTMIIVTHDRDEAKKMGDIVYSLD